MVDTHCAAALKHAALCRETAVCKPTGELVLQCADGIVLRPPQCHILSVHYLKCGSVVCNTTTELFSVAVF